MEDQNYTIKDIARMAGVSAGIWDQTNKSIFLFSRQSDSKHIGLIMNLIQYLLYFSFTFYSIDFKANRRKYRFSFINRYRTQK